MRLKILYEDNHLLAVLKPPGSLAQGDKTGDVPLVEHAKVFIKRKYEKPGNVFLGLCHRLDRPVSGVLLMARTSKALSRVNRMFAMGQIDKRYLAVTHLPPPNSAGIIEHWLRKDRTNNVVKYFDQPIAQAKKATTRYTLLHKQASTFLLLVEPTTGRSHQIRVALQSMGCPIVGDVKYGGRKHMDRNAIGLHCQSLQFLHPVKKIVVNIQADLPDCDPWSPFADLAL